VAGDWRNHFDSSVEDHFLETVEVLPTELGYPATLRA
jgi:hypothetical protein